MTEESSRYNRELCSYLSEFLLDRRRDLLLQLLRERTRHLTVVIEDIYQSHNASACVRSCDCFGLQDVHVIERRNAFRAARGIVQGSSQWVTIHRYRETDDEDFDAASACLQKLKDQGYQVVVTSPHDATCDLETYDVSQKTALVFGNEKSGISETVRRNADHIMRIPMYGFTESFNISVAVAVCLHHLVWKLRQLDINWRLTQEECEPLLLEWVRTASGRGLEGIERRFREEIESGIRPSAFPTWPDWGSILDTD